jgi:5'-phosphate synthase pdxT subunit
MSDPNRIGVLALQGNFREHAAMLRGLDAEPVEVRRRDQLAGLDGLVVPGGESTAIGRLMRIGGLEEPVAEFPGALLGTCAGMILFARDHLGLLDVEVGRNAFGRQVASFEADVQLEGEEAPLRGVFIRAPRVVDLGPEVEVLGTLDREPVLVRQGRVLAASFHPELTDDTRVHERFLQLVREESRVGA